MELDDAQSNVNRESDLRRLQWWQLNRRHLPSSRGVHFLAHELAQFLDQCGRFHSLGGQVKLPVAKLPKPLHQFSRIRSGQLLCLIGQL